MGKQFNDKRQGNRGPRQEQGPPAYVVPFATYVHRSEGNFLVKATDNTRFPKFNRGVYLQTKAKIGIVDEILGPIK